jgi:1-acyl-sn-glycerol-3-phosphate acyltransferase
MFYQIVKKVARVAIKFYCRDIKINQKALLKNKGPLLLAVNHPNSFLDAIILCTLFDEPVYSLARGDAFKGKLISVFLRSLKILPVYRVSEGVENLEENYSTFSACIELFKNNDIVLIFTEGRSENEWHLRPLKKGTARLALTAWQQNIPLKILPIGLNYNSFFLFGKNVHVNIGDCIGSDIMKNTGGENGRQLNNITGAIQQQLQQRVYEIDSTDRQKKETTFGIKFSKIKTALLLLPGFAGLVLHWPFYFILKKLIEKKAALSGHFDSIIVGALLIFYPFLILFWALVAQFFLGEYRAIVIAAALPVCGWCCMQLNRQID